MSTLLNGAPLNGGTPYVWAEGHSTATGTSVAVLRRAAYTASAPDKTEAISNGVATRLARPTGVAITGEAIQSLVITRQAHLNASVVGEGVGVGSAKRTAWMADTTGAAESVASGLPVRWRLGYGTAEPVATSTDDDALVAVYRSTRVRDTRGIAHTAINEKAIRRILVNQVPFRGTTIARARTSAIANSQLGFATSVAEAVEEDNNLLVNIARDAKGAAVAEGSTVVTPRQTHIINNVIRQVSDAQLYVAPDIYRADGSAELYNWAKPVAETVPAKVDALAVRIAELSVPEGSSSTLVMDTSFVRGVTAKPVGLVGSSVIAEGARINRWKWHKGIASAESSSSILTVRLAWVGAFGASKANATSSSASTRYRWKWLAATSSAGSAVSTGQSGALYDAEAVTGGVGLTTGVPTKLSGAVALTKASAALNLETITYHWTYVASTSVAEAVSARADGLKGVRIVPVKPVYAESHIPKVYFRLNAAEFAPDRRSVFVSARARLLELPASSREITVQ